MTLAIAKLTDADHADWERLFRGYIDFYNRTLTQAEYDRYWAAFREDKRVHALGAKLDGKLVGITHYFIHANTSGADVCYLQDLFTDAAVRGQGIGRALIMAVRDWAKTQGCGRLYWMTHESNATARKLYDKVAENKGFLRYQIELG